MKQQITVFQQNGSGQAKIKAIEEHGKGLFSIRIISIDTPLPEVIDDSGPYLPEDIAPGLVLDFLTHPDLSYDLALRCRDLGIPVVASGKKHRLPGTFTPPPDAGFPGRSAWAIMESILENRASMSVCAREKSNGLW
jgi:hypothetical protein